MANSPLNRRSQHWQRLAELVARASRARGLRSLSGEELLEFGRLYRRAASELSHARARGLDAAELAFLNALVGRAYGLLYVTRSSGWRGLLRFFRQELPRSFRAHARLIGLSAALFLGPALLGALLALRSPDLLAAVSPTAAAAIESLQERHAPGRDWLPADFRPLAGSFIMVNNIQVSFLAFGAGILLGLGTMLLLVYNGFLLGAIAAGLSRTPAAAQFWGFVAPHGVLEIPTIIISAAAGFLLALAVVEPGEHSRLDALRLAGREAAVLMSGVILLLAIAGLVEGLFSPSLVPVPAKLSVAAILAVAFASYALLAGRKIKEAPAP